MDFDEIQRHLASGQPMTPEERQEALQALGLARTNPTQGLQPIVAPGALQSPTGASGPVASAWTCCTGCARALWQRSARHGWRAYCRAMGHWSAEAMAPDEAASECGHFEARPGPGVAIEPQPGAASRPARELSATLVNRMVKTGRLLKAVPPGAVGDVLEEMGHLVPRRSEWLEALGVWARVTTPTRRQQKIIDAGLQCQEEPAQLEDIGYMARMLVQATMPHSKQDGCSFSRSNGTFRLSITAPAEVGLPYGSLPRLLLSWITTEACRTQSRELELGRSLSQFMEHLGEVPTGGRWGSVARVKQQTRRLIAATFVISQEHLERERGVALQVIDTYELWWGKAPGQTTVWPSTVRLGERFYQEVIDRPVPLDLRALRALKKSPMALDIYCWMTYRLSYLGAKTMVPWAGLQAQFGAGYTRPDNFRTYFLKQLGAVTAVYPGARYEVDTRGLTLMPSATHVAKRPRAAVGKPGI